MNLLSFFNVTMQSLEQGIQSLKCLLNHKRKCKIYNYFNIKNLYCSSLKGKVCGNRHIHWTLRSW